MQIPQKTPAIFLIASLLSAQAQTPPPVYYRHAEGRKPLTLESEVVVYGGTSSGSIAAIQAARMGRKTTLVSFNTYVGGLTSGGLTASDLGKKETIGGAAREFYNRLGGLTDFSTVSAETLYRTMLEEAGSFSSDLVDGSHRWPDGTFEPVNFSEMPPPRRGLPVPFRELYELREEIFQDHVTYQQGLLYFLVNDTRVPEELQKRAAKFGLDPDEFKDTGHWPHQLYVREARRMVSDYVMTQADCENLLVPVSLSASHVAFGSIRMEPVFMILGQSAGTAAALAIEGKQAVQDVPYEKLRELLLRQGQQL